MWIAIMYVTLTFLHSRTTEIRLAGVRLGESRRSGASETFTPPEGGRVGTRHHKERKGGISHSSSREY